MNFRNERFLGKSEGRFRAKSAKNGPKKAQILILLKNECGTPHCLFDNLIVWCDISTISKFRQNLDIQAFFIRICLKQEKFVLFTFGPN